jgi:hypothetical protein
MGIKCVGCGAEIADGFEVHVWTDTEMAQKTGFDAEAVRSYFGKDPPLTVCEMCGERFKVWDLERIRLVERLAKGH